MTARNIQLGTHKYIMSHMDIADWTAHHHRAVSYNERNRMNQSQHENSIWLMQSNARHVVRRLKGQGLNL